MKIRIRIIKITPDRNNLDKPKMKNTGTYIYAPVPGTYHILILCLTAMIRKYAF